MVQNDNHSSLVTNLVEKCRNINIKGNSETGAILNLIDKIKSLSADSKLKTNLISLEKKIETLILKDIDPIPDERKFYQDLSSLISEISNSGSDKTPNPHEEIQIKKEISPEKNTAALSKDNEYAEVVDDDMFCDFIAEIREYIEVLEDEIMNLENNPADKDQINKIFRPFHTLKGVSGFMGLRKLTKISHETENLLDLARNNQIEINQQVIEGILLAIDTIKEMISTLSKENREENLTDEKMEKVILYISTLSTGEKNRMEEAPLIRIIKDDQTIKIVEKSEESTDNKVKISTTKLDYLIDMIGELVINANLVKEDQNILSIRDLNFQKKFSQFSRVVGELQSASMSLRMVPVATTFLKMKRVVSDYSRKNNKPIELVMKGKDTEMDRNIVESLYDPLVHMIRNSCDHGIEEPEARIRNGKDATGIITLDAYHKGNSIIIDVIDDGKGLNRDLILTKALEKGMFKKNQILTDSEIYQVIFQPGFSTAEKITSVSGRGVGMDVVNQTIKQLGGSVKIKSELNKGTTISIILPLTLAIIDGMFVKSGDEIFIIPLINVIRTLQPEKKSLNLLLNKGTTVKVDGVLLPVTRLSEVFNLNNSKANPEEAILVILQAQNQEYALMVDALVGIQDVVVKTLGSKFKNLKGVSGATILGDGSVGLILDVNSLSSAGKTQGS